MVGVEDNEGDKDPDKRFCKAGEAKDPGTFLGTHLPHNEDNNDGEGGSKEGIFQRFDPMANEGSDENGNGKKPNVIGEEEVEGAND